MFDENLDMDDELETLLMSYDPQIIAAVRQSENDMVKGDVVWDDDDDAAGEQE